MIAFASLLTVATYYPQTNLGTATIIVSLIANTVGSMMPDLDQASNKLWDMLPYGDTVGKYLSKMFLSHRNFSHSIIGSVVMIKASFMLLENILNASYLNSHIVATSLMIGYISHLLADGVTEEGLPLLFPLGNKFGFPPIKSWRIKTDKWFERYVVVPGVLLYIGWIVIMNFTVLANFL